MQYKTVRRLHLALTLFMGLPLLVLCLTGAVLVFGKEIDRLVEPEVYTVTPRPAGPLPMAELLHRLQVQAPDVEPWSVGLGKEADAAWTLWLGKGAGVLVFDPYDGAVLSHRRPQESVNGFLTGVHRYWMVPEPTRRVVRNVLSTVALLLIVQVVVGTWLFLIPPKPLKRLAVKRGRMFVLRLHQTTGLATGLVMAVIAFTGFSIFWHEATKAVFVAAGVEISDPPEPETAGLAAVADLDGALALAQAELPEGRLLHFRVPDGPGKPLVAAFAEGAAAVPSRVWVGDDPPRVLAVEDRRDVNLGQWIWYSRYKIHMADFDILAIKLLWVPLALLPVGFMITGLQLHLRRRRRRATAERLVRDADAARHDPAPETGAP